MVTITVKKILILPVAIAIISVMFFSIQTVTAAGPLDLTGVDNFTILANTYTNAGTGIVLNGDLGYTTNASPGQLATVSGTTFAATPTYLAAMAIQSNLLTSANNPAQSGACTITRAGVTALDNLPQPLTPGVYCIDGAAHINTAGITLSGNGVYIFRINGALDTIANSHVTLAGANADKVFWVPTGGITLGANSVFAGIILTNAATTLGSTVSMNGRILSNGAVTATGPDTITSSLVTITPLVTATSPLVTITPLVPSLPATVQNNGGAQSSQSSLGLGNGVSPVGQVLSYDGNAAGSLFSSSYVVTPKVGVVNKAVFEIYEKGGSDEIRHIDLAFGLANGQIFSDSRIMIQWDKSWSGIETTKVIDPEHALTNVRVETSKGSCDAGVIKNDCLIVVLYHTFVAPLEFNIIATNVSDRISSLSYWNGYDRNDLVQFEQMKLDQELIAIGFWDSSKIQNHMPVIIDNVKYFAVDSRDTLKFEQMKIRQELIATGFWDSSEIQNHKPGITAMPYVDNRDTLKFEQMKLDQELIATGFWDSSKIQNHMPVIIDSVS